MPETGPLGRTFELTQLSRSHSERGSLPARVDRAAGIQNDRAGQMAPSTGYPDASSTPLQSPRHRRAFGERPLDLLRALEFRLGRDRSRWSQWWTFVADDFLALRADQGAISLRAATEPPAFAALDHPAHKGLERSGAALGAASDRHGRFG